MYLSKIKLFCKLFLVITLLATGCFLFYFHLKSIDLLLEFGRTLKPEGFVFKKWSKQPVSVYQKYYLFNWTNPRDVYEADSKPRFEEIGPFVFEDRREKVDVKWNDNGTITYRQVRQWFFDEAKSVGNLSTKITTINAVALSAAYSIRFRSYLLKKGLDFSLLALSPKIFVQKTVGELIFDGYEDPMINLAKALEISSSLKIPNADKFAWFYKLNDSNSGDIFNTKPEGNEIGQAIQWNYHSELPYFKGECNQIRGSLGDYHPLPLKRDKVVYFQTEICRPVDMDYAEDVEVGGIAGYKYTLGDSFLDNGTGKPENSCFDNNLPYGVVNVSSCKFEIPIFISLPHFYKADNYFIDKVEGLRANQTKHEMFCTLEPITGIPLRGAARFQLNTLLQPIKYISMFSDVPTVYIPVLWIEQEFELPFMYRLALKAFLSLPNVMLGAAVVCIALGIALILFGFRIIKIKRRKLLKRNVKSNEETITPEREDLLANASCTSVSTSKL